MYQAGELDLASTPQPFYTCSYNHAHRLRLGRLLYIELSRISNGFFKPLLDPGGGFTSETAERQFQKPHGRYTAISEVKRPTKCPFGCNGNVTAVVVGQSKRIYSGVGMFTGNYLSFL
jgi:hypothetical protein